MDIAVVGGGLAGLTAAVELHESGHAVQVFESSDRVGGRVATDEVDGHLLDRGFQIVLSAYPDAFDVLDGATLDLKLFAPGALVRYDGGFHRVGDPFQDPGSALDTVRAPIGSLGDKLRVVAFRRAVRSGTLDDLWRRPDTTALERLRSAGFGDEIIERFLRPLFAGITLDAELSGSSRVLEFIFRTLSQGGAGVPADGMAAIPAQLASRLPDDTIATGVAVNAVGPRSVTLADGEVVPADGVVVATDATTAARLCPATIDDNGWRSTTTAWFATDAAPRPEPLIMLNGDGDGPINSVAVMSNVAPGYAPSGSSTIAVSAPTVQTGLVDGFRRQLTEWFGPEVEAWETLRVDEVEQAQPIRPHDRARTAALPVDTDDGAGTLWVCGDHVSDPSINGAIVSGRAAARAMINALS